jgi:hypothetical protein
LQVNLHFAHNEAAKMNTQCMLDWSLISINKEDIFHKVDEKLHTFADHIGQNALNPLFSESKHVYIYYLYSFHANFLGYKMQVNMN